MGFELDSEDEFIDIEDDRLESEDELNSDDEDSDDEELDST